MPNKSDSKIAATLELPGRLVQTAGIAALLIAAHGVFLHTLFALVASLVWVKVTTTELPQELGELRVRRKLFATLGEWLGRSDGGDVFDKAYAEHLYMEEGIEAPQYDTVAKAKGMANLWGGILSFVLQCYLLVVIIVAAVERWTG